MAERTVTVAEFLFTRLRQLGCLSLHGLPGDFNLLALDYVSKSGLMWVGNCNELNAGYAADAYARIRGIGAICTTFGVGELSAVNAIAGSYAELAPVVHIVGTPARPAQDDKMILHHTLGNGDFKVFSRIYKEVTIAQTDLRDPKTAPAEIDRVLRACVLDSRPVYIELPTDMVTRTVDANLLNTPINTTPRQSDKDTLNKAITAFWERFYAADRPAFLIGGAVQRRRIMSEVEALVKKSGLPVFAAPMGKGGIDETLPNYIGVYAGEGSSPHVAEVFKTSDLIVAIGNIESDLNTFGFTYDFPRTKMIDIHYDHSIIGNATFSGIYLKSVIPRIEKELDIERLKTGATGFSQKPVAEPATSNDKGETITHEYLWPRISKFLKESDYLVTETGTSYVGYWNTMLPSDVVVINQIIWSSIGYGVGAAQGAGLAAKEQGKNQRTICFEGDGSFQLTAQEVSTIIQHDLDVTMFVIENDGYEIERWVHGMEASYNDVPQWKYSKIPEVLTPEGSKHPKTWKIRTRAELEELLEDRAFQEGKGLQLVEMHMDRGDAPRLLKEFGSSAAKRAS